MAKVGLKLLSTADSECINAVAELYSKKLFDYVELYVVPNTTDTIEKWKNFRSTGLSGEKISLPIMLEAPDYHHKINFANPDNFEINRRIFDEIEQFRQALNSRCTIITPGYRGNISETIRQLKEFKPKNIIVKNNVYRIAELSSAAGIGSCGEELEMVKKDTYCGFCLDIENAVCTANITDRDPYDFLRELNILNPIIYHISGNNISTKDVTGGNISGGDYNFSKLSLIIRNNALITLNTIIKEQIDVFKFRDDVHYLRRFCK